MDVVPGKFLFVWGWSLLIPPVTAIALLRGRLQDEPRSHHRRRMWIGLILSVVSWFLVATTIAIGDYFGAAQAAWDEVGLFDRIWIVAIDVLAAIGIVGLPRTSGICSSGTNPWTTCPDR